jgi:hypothetical protein
VWFRRATLTKLMFCSIHNRGCKPETLAGLDTALERVYSYDNHSGIQPIDAYEGAKGTFDFEKMGSMA